MEGAKCQLWGLLGPGMDFGQVWWATEGLERSSAVIRYILKGSLWLLWEIWSGSWGKDGSKEIHCNNSNEILVAWPRAEVERRGHILGVPMIWRVGCTLSESKRNQNLKALFWATGKMELPLTQTVSGESRVGKIKISVLRMLCLLDKEDIHGPGFQEELGLEMWICFPGKRRNFLRLEEQRDWGGAKKVPQVGNYGCVVSRRPGEKVFPREGSDQQCQLLLMFSKRRADNWPWNFAMWMSLVILMRLVLVELMGTKTWLERFKRGIREIRDFFFEKKE